MFSSGASNPSLYLGRRSAFFSYFGPQSFKNLKTIGENTDFSLNSESRLDVSGWVVIYDRVLGAINKIFMQTIYS
jgi:hypothetical protein